MANKSVPFTAKSEVQREFLTSCTYLNNKFSKDPLPITGLLKVPGKEFHSHLVVELLSETQGRIQKSLRGMSLGEP